MPRPQTIVCELCGGKFFKHSFAIHQKQCIAKVEKSTTHCPVCGLVVSNDEYNSHVTGCKKLKEEYKARAARAGTKPGGRGRGRGGARGGRSASGRGRGRGAAGGGGGAAAPVAPADPAVKLMSKVPDYIKKRYLPGADGEPPADPLAELLEKPTKAIHNMTDIPEFADGEDDGRMECEYCGRKFNRGRIAKHQLVCANAQAREEERKAKVKPMNGQKLRLKGTEFLKAKRVADRDTKHREMEAKVAAGTANGWREEHIRMQQIAHADDEDGGHAAAAAAADEAKAHRERLAAKAAEAARTLNRDTDAAAKIEAAHGLPPAAPAAPPATATTDAPGGADGADAAASGADGAIAAGPEAAPVAASGAGADVLNTTQTSVQGKRGPRFHVGDRIRFKSDGRVGFVRFRGPVWGLKKGTWLGIEVRPDCGTGKHSGECQGVPYFRCENPGQGCFTRRDRVDPFPPSQEEQEAEYKRVDQENEIARKEVLGMVKTAGKGKKEKGAAKGKASGKSTAAPASKGATSSASAARQAREARTAAATARRGGKPATGASAASRGEQDSGRGTRRQAPGSSSARVAGPRAGAGAASATESKASGRGSRPGSGSRSRTGATKGGAAGGGSGAGAAAATRTRQPARRGLNLGKQVPTPAAGSSTGGGAPASKTKAKGDAGAVAPARGAPARSTPASARSAAAAGTKSTAGPKARAGVASSRPGSGRDRPVRGSPAPVAGRRAAAASSGPAAGKERPAAGGRASRGTTKPEVPSQRKAGQPSRQRAPKRDALDEAMAGGGKAGAGTRRSRPSSGRGRAAGGYPPRAAYPTIDEMRDAKDREIERNAAFLRALAGKGAFPEGMAPSTAGGGTTAGTRDAIAQAQQPSDVWARSGAKKQGTWGKAQRVGGGGGTGKEMLSAGSGRKLGGGGGDRGAVGGAGAGSSSSSRGLKRASSLRQAGSLVTGGAASGRAGRGSGSASVASGSARAASGRAAGGSGKAGGGGGAASKGDSRRAARAAYFDRLLQAKSGNEYPDWTRGWAPPAGMTGVGVGGG